MPIGPSVRATIHAAARFLACGRGVSGQSPAHWPRRPNNAPAQEVCFQGGPAHDTRGDRQSAAFVQTVD